VAGRWLFAHRGISVRFAEPSADDAEWSLGEAIAAAGAPRDEQSRYVIERLGQVD
jgi:hypothetical protein